MKKKSRFNILLDSESEQFDKLNTIVTTAIEEEKLISQKLFEFESKDLNYRDRLADRIASFGGSWKFIVLFFLFILGWMALNIYMLTGPFDPYPFILLNLIL
ncbi:MAG TPA: DUF1003 domain-containing protein, partial [Chitinophagaceae bacterium]